MKNSFTIAVVGDCFPNARFYADGAPITGGFTRTLEILRGADLRFANFEMPLTNRGVPFEKLAAIRADPQIAQDVKELGFDVVSLANNHAFDYGADGFSDTVEALDAIRVQHIGAGMSLDEATTPLIMNVNGATVGFLAFSCLAAAGAAASDERPGVAPIHVHSGYEVNPYWVIEEPGEPLMVTIRTRADTDDQTFAEECVRQLREKVDVLLLSIHWGYGASDELAEYQQPLGHALLDAGADAIFGNHVHAVHGIEMYRDKPILYSPGTFVGRQIPVDPADVSELMQRILASMSPDGYIAQLSFDREGCSVALVPTSIDGNGLPIIVEGEDLDRIAARIANHSKRLGTDVHRVAGALVPVKPKPE